MTSWVRRLAVVVVVLSGCTSTWTQFGHGPENQRHNAAEQVLTRSNVATLSEVWSAPVGQGTSAPVVAGGRVHIRSGVAGSSPQMDLVTMDAATGERLWTQPLPPGSGEDFEWSPPAALSGAEVHLGTGSSFTRYDPATGDVIGQVPTGQPVRSPVVTGSGVHALVTVSPTWASERTAPVLQVRDTATLAERWRGALPSRSGGIWPSPVVSIGSGHVFVATRGFVHAFAIDGCGAPTCPPVWSQNQPASGSLHPAILNPPVVAGNTVYVASSRYLSAYDVDTGAELWRDEIAEWPSRLAIAAGHVFLANYDHLLVYAADGCGSATCEPAWMTELETVAMTPSVAGGVVYLGVGQTIHAFDVNGCGATTCEPLASVPAAGAVITISVAEGRLYANTTNPNTVTAFAPTQ